MPYGPGYPAGSLPVQPPPQSLYPPKSIPSPPPSGPVISDNGIYRISNLVATYRRVSPNNHSSVIREDAKYLNKEGVLIGGPIGEITVFEESHGGNPHILAFVFRNTTRAPGSDILRIRLDSEFADYFSAHHIYKGFTYDLQLVTPGSTSPPPTAAPPPYSFIPGSKPLGSPGGNPPAPPPGPGPLSPPPQEEKKKNPPIPGRGPLRNPPPADPKNPPSKAPGSPPAKPPTSPPAAPPTNPPKKEEKPRTPALPKNPGAIGPPAPAPVTKEYATSDPVLNFRNQPNTGPSAKKPDPTTGLGLSNPFVPPSALVPAPPKPSPIPGAPTTSPIPGAPTTSPIPEKDKKAPILPPLPIGNAKDPQIKPAEDKKQPVVQTPGGGGCCTPPGIGQANQSLDGIKLLLEGIDLSLLQVINAKLGPQISGGLSGYLLDRFTKLWKSRTVDRALSLMATAAAIHNAVMLSRNIGSTLISTLGNALSIIGIKDGDEIAQNFSTVIGNSIENIVKGLVGNDNYTALSETWAKANRIYQSAINIYQLMTDSLFGITSGLEQTAKYTGKIGNALRKSGVILENSYNWMSETFNFSSGKNRKIDRVIQGLQQASEVASDLESITSEFRSVTENVAEIGTQINTIRAEVTGKEETKKNIEDTSKNSSQSPQINKSDLTKPEN